MPHQIVNLQSRGDSRGQLVALENGKNIPFAVQRVYYLFDTKMDVTRGYHAHRELRQLAIAVRGSCTFVIDDGQKREDIVLNDPTKGLLIEGLLWREMHSFSYDCIVMVLADSLYDETDYIRNYEQFLREVNG